MISLDFTGKNVMITGAGGSIAGGIARRYAAAGANLHLTDLNADRLKPIMEELAAQGVKVTTAPLDVTDEAGVRAEVERFAKEAGSLDVMVNAAGIFAAKLYLDTTAAEFERMLKINLIGLNNGLQSSVRVMKKQGYGRIVNVASASTRVGSPYFAHYSASKFGVQSLTQSAALECAGQHITVNAVCPGLVKSDMTPPLFNLVAQLYGVTYEQALEQGEKDIPMGRFQTPEDIGNMAVFLSSPMSENITGQCFNVDGGMHFN